MSILFVQIPQRQRQFSALSLNVTCLATLKSVLGQVDVAAYETQNDLAFPEEKYQIIMNATRTAEAVRNRPT